MLTETGQAGALSQLSIEVTPAMIDAGVEVLRHHLDQDRFMGLDHRLVAELVAASLAARPQ